MPLPSPPLGGARQADAPLTRLSSHVLAARAEELELLVRAVRSPPAVVVVEGEAGVGKTRLVEELYGGLAADGLRVLTGHCHPMPEPFPLGPVVEAVRTLGDDLATLALSPLAGVLRPLLPELADRLPPGPGPLGDPSMERHRLWRALAEVLGALGPAVVVLEDLHWADDATPQFLTFLAAQPPADLALVLTSRVENLPATLPLRALFSRLPASTSMLRLRLHPLGPDDVKVVIGAILDTDQVSDEFAAYLHERTAGIPLAVEEVLRLLVDRHDIVRWRGRWARRALEQVEVPAAIRDSVLERTAGLAPDARRVVEAAAVLAEPGPESLLAAVAGLSAVRAAKGLVAALAAGALQAAGDGYACRHALAAQAVYDAIAAPQRSWLHKRAARALEAGAEVGSDPRLPARLAHHWKEGGEPRSWVRWAEEAAVLANTLGDPGAGVTLLLDAVAASGLDAATRGRLALALARAAVASLAQVEAIQAVRHVLDTEVLPPSLRGRLRFNLGSLLHQAGDASQAHAEFALAVPDLEDSPGLLAQVMIGLALPWVAENDVEHHLGWLGRACGLADDFPEQAIAAMTDGDRAAILVAVGDRAGWAAVPPPPAPGASLGTLQDRARLCTNVAINAFYLGHDARAGAFVTEGLRICEDTGYQRMSPALHTAQVLLDWAGGRWDGIETGAREVVDSQPDVPSLVQVTMVLGHVALARGEVGEAEERLAEVAHRARKCGALPLLGMAAAGLARVRLADDDPAGASAVEAAGKGADAAAHFDRATSGYRRLARPYDEALAAEGKARCLLGTEPEAGMAAATEALAIFHRLGATWDEARVRRLLRQHEVAVPYPAAAAGAATATTCRPGSRRWWSWPRTDSPAPASLHSCSCRHGRSTTISPGPFASWAFRRERSWWRPTTPPGEGVEIGKVLPYGRRKGTAKLAP